MKNSSNLLDNATIMLALTYECQCKCPHCGAGKSKKSGYTELTKEEIINIIDQSHPLGAKAIYFFGGEPLLVATIFKYITHSKNLGLLTRLDTNGLLLDETMITKLKKSGLDFIRVSIDSPDAQIHDALRGVQGGFEKAIEGLKLCKKYSLDSCISSYVTKKTLKDGSIQRIITLGKSLGAKIRLLSPICTGKWQGREDMILNNEEIQWLRSHLEKGLVFWEKIDDKNTPFSCRSLDKELVYISAYGDVQPCCYWPLVFGNTRKESLKDIITRMRRSDIFIKNKNLCDCPINSQQTI